jgi:hypothetical protein
MKRWSGKWQQQRRWDQHYRDFGYTDNYQQSWWQRAAILRKIVVSMALFGVFYTFHDGEHWLARMMDNGVRYILTKHVDPVELMERVGMSKYSNIDLSVFKNLPPSVKNKPAETMIMPVEGKIVENFGWRVNANTKEQKYYEGIDWEASLGAPVKTVAAGQVKAVTDSTQYGRTIVIQHSGDMESIYGYCADILVKDGDVVTQGQIIAKVGKMTNTDMARLHFEIRIKDQAVDPKTKLNIVGP